MDHNVTEVEVAFKDLVVGQLYPIKQAFKETCIIDHKTVVNIKLDISNDTSVRTTTYVPRCIWHYALMHLDNINESARHGQYYTACCYGVISNPNSPERVIGRIHNPGTVVASQGLLWEVGNMFED